MFVPRIRLLSLQENNNYYLGLFVCREVFSFLFLSPFCYYISLIALLWEKRNFLSLTVLRYQYWSRDPSFIESSALCLVSWNPCLGENDIKLLSHCKPTVNFVCFLIIFLSKSLMFLVCCIIGDVLRTFTAWSLDPISINCFEFVLVLTRVLHPASPSAHHLNWQNWVRARLSICRI